MRTVRTVDPAARFFSLEKNLFMFLFPPLIMGSGEPNFQVYPSIVLCLRPNVHEFFKVFCSPGTFSGPFDVFFLALPEKMAYNLSVYHSFMGKYAGRVSGPK